MFDFSEALRKIKMGVEVRRIGDETEYDAPWLILVPAHEWHTSVGPSNIPNTHRLPWIARKKQNGDLVPWVPSQEDLFAEDYVECDFQ